MTKIALTVVSALALSLFAAGALALDADIMRDIRRADTVEELAKMAEELADRTVSPERESRPVPSLEDLKAYLQFIQIRMDAAISAKSDKQHKELITELKK